MYFKTESMNASELRIGNWVKVPTTDGSDVFTQIEPSNYCHEWNSEISIESYNPIPLTEEWLVKFGFEKIYHSWIHDEFDFDIVMHGHRYVLADISEDSGRYFAHGKFQFVHQLQNLYFALTGEELTLKEKL